MMEYTWVKHTKPMHFIEKAHTLVWKYKTVASINIVDNLSGASMVQKGIITLTLVFVLTAKHCMESTQLHHVKVCLSYIE
jgi:hypothetical protein